MIRQATKYDRQEVIELMLLFKQETGIRHLQEINNYSYWQNVFDSIVAGAGIIYLESGKGLAMGIITPSIWCNKTLILHELAWYIKPEHRKTSLGYKLFKTYIDKAEELKQSGRISAYTMAKLFNSPDFDYARYGFNKLDETWIK